MPEKWKPEKWSDKKEIDPKSKEGIAKEEDEGKLEEMEIDDDRFLEVPNVSSIYERRLYE